MASRDKCRPYRIWDFTRSVKKAIVAGSLSELLSKGAQKLGYGNEQVRAVMEEDGTEIADNDYLSFLENPIILLLRDGENWLDVRKEPRVATHHCFSRDEADGDHEDSLDNQLDSEPDDHLQTILSTIKKDYSKIVILSHEEKETIADADINALAKGLGVETKEALRVQLSCQRYLDDRSTALDAVSLLKSIAPESTSASALKSSPENYESPSKRKRTTSPTHNCELEHHPPPHDKLPPYTYVFMESRGEDFQSHLNHPEIGVQCYKDATISSICEQSLDIIAQDNPKLVLVFAGLNDLITIDKSTNTVHPKYDTVTALTSHVLQQVQGAWARYRTEFPSLKVGFAPIIGMDLAMYNTRNPRAPTHPLQGIFDESVFSVNYWIKNGNIQRKIVHPITDRKIYKCKKGKTLCNYQQLTDGMNPQTFVLADWAAKIIKFHEKNKTADFQD